MTNKERKYSNRKIRYDKIRQVLKMLNDGEYTAHILETLSVEWGCSKRNVEKYISLARKQIKDEITKQDKEDFFSKWDFLYNLCIKDNNKQLANTILATKAKFALGEKLSFDKSLAESISEITIKVKKRDESKEE